MRSFRDYLAESEHIAESPVTGDFVDIVVNEEFCLETDIVDFVEDGVVVNMDEHGYSLLEQFESLMDDIDGTQIGVIDDDREMHEAEYQGREVKLGKPMQGDVKKFKVYVRDPKTGNIKKVNFGDPNMGIRRDNPKARKNFRARHGCGTPRASDRTKARYWSCRMWSKKPVSKILRGK
jgi:hypothetical protein